MAVFYVIPVHHSGLRDWGEFQDQPVFKFLSGKNVIVIETIRTTKAAFVTSQSLLGDR